VPPIVPSLHRAGELLGFGLGVTGVALLSYMTSQVDYFIVGRQLDSVALGLYTRAFTLAMFPVALLAYALYPVLFPTLSHMQDDLPRLRSVFRRTVTSVALVGYPVLALLNVSAPELIPALLGPNWSGAVVPVQILCGMSAIQLFTNLSGAVLKAVGKVYIEWWWQLARIALLAPGVWVAAVWGISAVAWAVLAAYLLWFCLDILLLRACIGFGFSSACNTLARPIFVSSTVLVTSLEARLVLINSAVAPMIVLLCTHLTGIATSAIVIFLLCPKEITFLRQRLQVKNENEY